jgi:hypothetical protein
VVRWDALIFAVVLLGFPYGIRNYAPNWQTQPLICLTAWRQAGTNGRGNQGFIGDVNEELPVVPDVPAVIIATPEFTATPFPTPSVNFAATATAYFESHPTAVPPQPTATLEPTRYVCRTIQDIQAGCTPPTPVPGN